MNSEFIRVVFVGLLGCAVTMAKKAGLKFVVIGDLGGLPFRPYSTIHQRRNSWELAKIPEVDFFLGVGDNFYSHGIRDADDARFLNTFENVYAYPSLFKDWYMIAGNHDHLGNISAQILYSKKSKRWKFPHYFYTKVFNIPTSNKTLQIVMLDTTALCYRRWSKQNKLPTKETQMKWLLHTLKNSKADYLILSGHHPMYSAGWHGPSECIQKAFADMFRKHRVTAYFSGHDHNLQHIKVGDSPVHYFVTGSGSFVSGWKKSIGMLEPNSLKQFCGKRPGFIIVTAKPNRLEVQFHTAWRPHTYHQILRPRQQQSNKVEYPELLMAFFHSMKKNSTHNKPSEN